MNKGGIKRMKVAWSFLATIVLGAVITTQAEATTQPTKKQEETHDLSIHDIQGDKHNSPYDGKKVTDVQGIVTYQYKLKGSNYIHIQTPDKAKDDNPNTSEGLIVYMGNQDYDVKTGDFVNVTGIVDEYHIDGYDDK